MPYTKASTALPKAITGTNCHNGPMPNSFASTGEISATTRPDTGPAISAAAARTKFTSEPVTNCVKDLVTYCTAISSAISTAVCVIQRTLLFLIFYPLLLFS